MKDNPFDKLGLDPLIANWMKLTTASLGEMGNQWQQFTKSDQDKTATGGPGLTGSDSLESLLKSWQMMSSTFSNPDTVSSNMSGLSQLPNVMMKFAQTQAESFSRFQKQMLDKLQNSSSKNDSSGRPSFDKDFFTHWKAFYEQELRQYLNIPQLGLTRFHQEKFNQLIDRYIQMQTTVGEFMNELFRPMERSLKLMQDKYLELAENDQLSDDPREYYRMWIRELEKDYNGFFRSPEYLTALSKTLTVMAEFKSKRDEILEDFLATLPIPSERDMNELFKEIHRLKRKVRDLEKEKTKANT